jgi:hypothetical protein
MKSREQLPSSAEEGKAEAAAEAGVVLFNKINLLINTTPALRATPPQLRRGVVPLPKEYGIDTMNRRSNRISESPKL